MKRLLILVVLVSMLFAISGVLAVGEGNQTQGLNGSVAVDIHLAITPSTVDFNTPLPGTINNPAINGPITFNAAGSNANVIVVTVSVAGVPFDTGLKLDGQNPIGKQWTMNCSMSGNVCSYTPVTTIPTLDIQAGFRAGAITGVITYSISGQIPA